MTPSGLLRLRLSDRNASNGRNPDRLPGAVDLVAKDVALRLKAKALNLPAEDYGSGKVHHESLLYSGKSLLEHVCSETVGAIHEHSRIPAEMLSTTGFVKSEFLIIRG